MVDGVHERLIRSEARPSIPPAATVLHAVQKQSMMEE
jgi:hypothetical protein